MLSFHCFVCLLLLLVDVFIPRLRQREAVTIRHLKLLYMGEIFSLMTTIFKLNILGVEPKTKRVESRQDTDRQKKKASFRDFPLFTDKSVSRSSKKQ